jgi:hypothetical protein
MGIGTKMTSKIKGIELPSEVADQIALASLKDHRRYLKSELAQWKKNPKTDDNPQGYWMHPEDVAKSTVLIKYFDEIIKYYGG